jgi:hypothetical protein
MPIVISFSTLTKTKKKIRYRFDKQMEINSKNIYEYINIFLFEFKFRLHLYETKLWQMYYQAMQPIIFTSLFYFERFSLYFVMKECSTTLHTKNTHRFQIKIRWNWWKYFTNFLIGTVFILKNIIKENQSQLYVSSTFS